MKNENTKSLPILYLIAPCYNEEKVLPLTYSLFENKIEQLIIRAADISS